LREAILAAAQELFATQWASTPFQFGILPQAPAANPAA